MPILDQPGRSLGTEEFMPDTTSKYLLSDADALRRIKFAQFRAQMPALLLVAVAIALKSIFPNTGNWLYTVALALAILGIVIYFFIGLCFRYRQRIPLPLENALLSPIEGRIEHIRGSGDVTLLTVRKKLLDSVELRSPHSACHLEDGELWLDTAAGKISFRFNFSHIQWFVEPDLSAGNIIGIVGGTGSCSVIFPGKPGFSVQPGDPVQAADPLISQFPGLGNSLPDPALEDGSAPNAEGDNI